MFLLAGPIVTVFFLYICGLTFSKDGTIHLKSNTSVLHCQITLPELGTFFLIKVGQWADW